MYKVNLDIFQGPLDLLLHLIEKMEIDIHKVSILKLTESYLEYLHSVDEISLSNAQEYIVMASSLIHLKSKRLLPKVSFEEEENNYEEEIFVKQLIEYKNYKNICENFDAMYKKRNNLGEKQSQEININPKLMNIKIDTLHKYFKNIIKQKNSLNQDTTIKYKKEISLEKIKEYIINNLKLNNEINLITFVDNSSTREEIIAIFLSVLDLINKNKIDCYTKNEIIYLKIIE